MAKSPQPRDVQSPTPIGTKRSAATVTVASKLPMSIELQLCTPKTARMTGQFGSVEETVHVKTGAIYVIRGTGYPSGQTPKGYPKRPNMIEDAGYALTPNVNAEWFAEWLKQNAETDLVRNGLIKAHEDLEYLEADAMEFKDVDTGLGPVNPDGDARAPKPLNALISDVKPAQRTAA